MKDGIIKIAVGSPRIRLCDCGANAKNIIKMVREMSAQGVKLAGFTELGVTGYTSGDLFNNLTLLEAAERSVGDIIRETADVDMLFFIGIPAVVGTRMYNCAAAVCKGRLLAIIPKTELPNYSEFYEKRYFSPAPDGESVIHYASFTVPFGERLILECEDVPGLVVGAEICEDLWVVQPPSGGIALSGATVIFNLSCSNEVVGKADYRRAMVRYHSGRLVAAYAFASAGAGESTSDTVFSGHCMISENAEMLAEMRWRTDSYITADVDLQRLCAERRRMTSFGGRFDAESSIKFSLDITQTVISRHYSRTPFVPSDTSRRNERCEEILTIQSNALAARMKSIGCEKAVLGLSGGLDSTLALIATVRTYRKLDYDLKGIIAVTMPGFGTTRGTKSNAQRLAEAYGVTLREISIAEASALHLKDIGHDGVTTDVTYENAQARERTQVLMDIANMNNGIVIGTGDLSELALGWATYNGDHMSMYGINGGIPKTLVRYIVAYEASIGSKELSSVLTDIYNTPVSPELLPPNDGDISQITEDIVGPYVLHDFFLFYHVRYGFKPDKIFRLARHAFGDEFSGEVIKKWLIVFLRRFFAQQFKRNCLPDGPKVGSVALSPRGDWRMPSDAIAREWLSAAESIEV